ncbi:MAG: helix-turn-helix domain-containing protein [Trichocoleus desertorum ATA4-8-CV12]|nr:helix-turn-helix domain-containing protein [Trichocoleus desertorum ATA4-8-CV12]
MDQTFGKRLREARRSKGYSQRELAGFVDVDYTYLSKLENDRADYPPKEDVLRALARHLELDAEELSYLAGRITAEDAKVVQDLAKTHQKQMPVLLRTIRDNPAIAQRILQEAQQEEHPEDL